MTDCGSCSADPKIHHPGKLSSAMCEHTEGILREFVVVFHRDICREHSLIGRRNCLMIEAANSLSAAAGPELSMNYIGILSPIGLAWLLGSCVLWRPGASVGRTQAER